MFLPAGGTKQYSSKGWTHQGRRPYFTGAELSSFSDQLKWAHTHMAPITSFTRWKKMYFCRLWRESAGVWCVPLNIKNLYLIISCYSSYYIIIFSSAPSLSVSLWILVLLYKTTCWVRLNRPDQLSFLYIFGAVAVIRLGFCDLWRLCTMRSELQIV